MDEIKLKHFLIPGILLLIVVTFFTTREGYSNKNKADLNEEGSTLGIEAEQSGSSPESGATSRLKQAYDWLDTKGTNYGDEQPSDYPYTHSTYWQRIIYSAMWEPDGTATESDVRSGKTFYSGSNNRVQKTGTAAEGTSPGAYYQQYVEYDDAYTGDYEGEESTWTKTNALSGSEVWYDTRTGLYWSYNLGSYSNSFTISSCDFYSTEPRGDYDGSDVDCGNAINACGTLSLASTQGESNDIDWYLPSQKELQRAYLNGIYNQAGATFTTSSFFWSSTEISTNGYVFYMGFHTGFMNIYLKTNSYAVRCVRRD
jgi:hypothetical protein